MANDPAPQVTLAERADAQPATARCYFCRWTFRGTVQECRDAARSHRLLKHPEAKRTARRQRRGGPGLFMFRQHELDSEALAEIEDERRKRAKVTGVEL